MKPTEDKNARRIALEKELEEFRRMTIGRLSQVLVQDIRKMMSEPANDNISPSNDNEQGATSPQDEETDD